MSSIQKLSIQGIRSFGPDDNNRGVVEFHSPLTLILGPNGTGKTTIIESLKYITTGDFPPGGSKDGAFIHDPKIAREAEIKGQIRLQFKDMQGNTQVVTRSVIAKQQAKKITVRTLEGTIAKHGKDGRTQTISNKCADLNQEMVSLLGVSKAVLENVIFCHQEDSNWPLSEGKVVKSKFDDIFASTRYVKALDKIIKLRKELAGEIKLLENDVGYLKVNKDKATKYASDLEELKCRYQASKESVTALDERLAPIGDKLEKIDSEEADLNELRTKIEKLKSERTEMQTSLKDLQANIENEYTGTTEELQTMLKDFQRKVDEREDSLHNIQRNLNKVERDLESANKLKTKQLLENGRLEQEAQHNLENIERRNGKIQRYVEKYDLTGFDDQIDDEQYRNFEMAMQEKAAVIEQKGKTKKMEYEEKESILQKEIEEQSSQKTKIETELKIKGDRLNTISLEMRDINHQLSLVDASENILEDVKNDLERAMCKCRDAEGSVDSDALRREVKDLQKTKTTLEAEYKQLDAELQRMHLESKTRTQLEMLKRDKTAKEDTIRRLKNKNEDGLQEVFGEIPQSNLRKLIDNYIRKQGSSVQEATQSLQELRIKLSSKETERKTLMDHQHQKERELREHEEKIYTECESQNFDEGLESISNRIQINQEKYGLLTGSNHVFTNYKTKLGRQDPPCPLCKRPFDTIQEAEELSKELETKLSMLPEKSQKVKQDLEKFQSKYDRMQQLKPLRTSITTLKERELPGLKQKIKLCNETIEELRKDIETNEDKLECLQVDEASAKSIQPDMVRIDGFEMEIRELDRKIDAQSAKLNTGDSNRTTDSVSSEREEKQLQLESSNRDLEYKRDKLTSHTERVQQLKTEANDLLARKLQLDKDLQQRQKLEENKTQLQSEHEVLNCAIQEGQQLLQPKRDAIAQLTEDKEILTGKKERDLEIVREQISKIRDGYKDVKTIQRHITGYIEEGKEGLLKQNIEKTAELEAKAAKLDAERNGYQEEVAEIKDDLAKQQVRFRELNDNLSARRKENAIKQKSENIEELDKQLGGLDVNNLTRQRRQLKEDYAKIEKEKHVAEGRQRGHEDQMKSIKVELRSDAYHKAEEKYRDKVITLKTTQLVTTDLQKYYAALDGSINSYHKTKMSDINQIVAELWRNTYRGNDIDTIEIRSDDDVGNSASNRRTFNYRVVMMKGETAIDMRGRCSAGQKVLASLIIRLALAETFCLNCGIIALDEPTTNLDRRNIESLALSLVEIIKSRRSQSNFQLICITHDEEFVEQLGRAEFVEKFCRVGKDPFGCSRITGCNVSQLHQ